MRIRISLILLLACFLPVSCVQEVDFSVAFEKKVVVQCVIHSVVKVQGNTSYTPRESVYHKWPLTSPQVQYLYMYYNSPDGKKERLPSATARLFDNETGILLGEFSRVSDWEWQLAYEPVYEQLGEDIKKYSLDLRLEISNIPGQERPIIGKTHFERTINGNDIRWLSRRVLMNYFYDYTQYASIMAPAWILPETFNCSGYPLASDEIACINNRHVIFSSYAFADAFNYAAGSYHYGVRILPDNYQGIFDLQMKDLAPYDQETQSWDDAYFLLSYVSEDYDRYLYDAIVYRMHHDNENDPMKHLYEDQVFSNIEGGIGIFGTEAVVYFEAWTSDRG